MIESGLQTFEADNMIVATGAHHVPKLPPFASELGFRTLTGKMGVGRLFQWIYVPGKVVAQGRIRHRA